jgi:hypothetical protein
MNIPQIMHAPEHLWPTSFAYQHPSLSPGGAFATFRSEAARRRLRWLEDHRPSSGLRIERQPDQGLPAIWLLPLGLVFPFLPWVPANQGIVPPVWGAGAQVDRLGLSACPRAPKVWHTTAHNGAGGALGANGGTTGRRLVPAPAPQRSAMLALCRKKDRACALSLRLPLSPSCGAGPMGERRGFRKRAALSFCVPHVGQYGPRAPFSQIMTDQKRWAALQRP